MFKKKNLAKFTFVGSIIQVDEVFLEIGWESSHINGITVVLTGNVALTGGQIKSWDVVGTVSVLELDGAGTSCKSKQLMSQADTKDW